MWSLQWGNRRQAGEEIADIGLVEGLRQLGQDEFAPVVDFGHDDAGAIAPVVFADGQPFGWDSMASGGGRRRTFTWLRGMEPPFSPQTVAEELSETA